MYRQVAIAGLSVSLGLSGAAGTAGAWPEGEGPHPVDEASLSSLPVREVTVFKDGHALVVHEGRARMNAAGDVVLDGLPAPIMGTFWPYEREAAARLAGVRAGTVRVAEERSARSIAEMIEANLNRRARVTEHDGGAAYECTIIDLPAAGNDGTRIAVLGTEEGRRIVPLTRIRDITFIGEPETTVRETAERNVLTMDLDWEAAQVGLRQGSAGAAGGEADVGLMYVQKGLRWIPSYRIVIDESGAGEGGAGGGTARLELQATLVNELADLEDVAVNLVIGVPSFAFKDTLDPISMQEQVAQLSSYFQSNSQTRYALSNAIMSQTARMGESRGDAGAGLEPQWPAEDAALAGDQRDELFVFRIESLTLRKGERMVVPVTLMETIYEDVFSYEVPMIPPMEVAQHHGGSGQQEQWMQDLLFRRNVMRRIRINNTAGVPITTAPALIMRGGQVLAQGMTTYAAPGATCDVDVTAAVNIKADYADEETGREPKAMTWRNSTYSKISQRGVVTLTNHTGKPVTVEAKRLVLGHVEAISHDGRQKALSLFDLQSGRSAAAAREWPYPYWSWPWWWRHVNAVSEISWEVTLDAGETVELGCEWHYFAP